MYHRETVKLINKATLLLCEAAMSWGFLSVEKEAFSCSQGRGRAATMRATGACSFCSRVV